MFFLIPVVSAITAGELLSAAAMAAVTVAASKAASDVYDSIMDAGHDPDDD